MGGGSWNNDFYKEREVDRVKSGTPTFAYSDNMRSAKPEARKVHASLDPKGVTRESRDSVEHPESVAIAVMIDVTGSMRQVPMILQQKLPTLMTTLVSGGYVKDPQILFGAIGDFYSGDKGSMQIGQFESDIRMDDHLTNVWIESGGGGNRTESYQNALYFFARHTSIDCFEKREKKGYLFITGDEMCYENVSNNEVEALFGVNLEVERIPTANIVAELKQKYHVFYLIPGGTSYFNDREIEKAWSDLIGPENVLKLEDPGSVCEAIAMVVGICEGTSSPNKAREDLKAHGSADASVNIAAGAVTKLAKSRNVETGATIRL